MIFYPIYNKKALRIAFLPKLINKWIISQFESAF